MLLQNLLNFIIISMHIDEVPVSARVENNPTREYKSFHTRFGLDQSKDPAQSQYPRSLITSAI